MIKRVESGEGWRVGWNPSAETFCGLVAGQGWAVELTATEFSDFCRVAEQLRSTMKDMSEQLMEEERLTCEQETEAIWMEAEGYPFEYSLRFILLSGRRAEGEWSSSVVPAMLEALKKLEKTKSLAF